MSWRIKVKGAQRLGILCVLPAKRRSAQQRSAFWKAIERVLRRRRIQVEHVFARLKRFRILASRYRNRHQRLGLRFNLIAGIYNFERTSVLKNNGQKIAVEIKTFLGASSLRELHVAVGQLLNYRLVLAESDPERSLYLAIPAYIYNTFSRHLLVNWYWKSTKSKSSYLMNSRRLSPYG